MKAAYIIGGSPCCGKSTAAKQIAADYGMEYFEADEYLEECVRRGKKEYKPYCTKQADVYGEEKWMQDPACQAEEELLLYEEILPYMMEILQRKRKDRPVIAEGAVFLPSLMARESAQDQLYVCIVPEKAFQIQHYMERLWAWEVVDSCEDPKEAFSRWMQRDALFAEEVRKQAQARCYPEMVVDGTKTKSEVYEWICQQFELKR